MKPLDFYPTTYTYVDEVKCTDALQNLSVNTAQVDYMDPYYMGYINADDLPGGMMYTRVFINSDGDVIFQNPQKRNHAWGYVSVTASSGVPTNFVGAPNTSGVIQRVGGSGSRGARFINEAVMARYASTNKCTLKIRYIVIPEADLDTNDSAFNIPDTTNHVYQMQEATITIPVITTDALGAGLDKFYAGTGDLDFGDVTIMGETVSMKFTGTDFSDPDNPTYRRSLQLGGVNYVMFVQLSYYDYYCYGRYRKTNMSYGSVSIAPFIEMDSFDDATISIAKNCKWINVNTSCMSPELEIEIDNIFGEVAERAVYRAGGYLTANNIAMGDFHVQSNKMNHGSGASAYWYAANSPANYPGFGRHGIIRGRHITYPINLADNVFAIYPYYSAKDAWLSIIPFHKLDTLHNTNGATLPANNYTADYSTAIFDANAWTDERRQDTTANLRDVLMLWQQPDAQISVDDFDISDMPVYETTDDVMDKFTGDSIFLNTGSIGCTEGFITHWVIDKQQVKAFGDYIWTNLLDFDAQGDPRPGIWENVKIAANTYWGTGSLDPASVMSFVIGLRYYPFELHNKSTATADNKIYFGTGRAGVPVRTVGSYTRKLDDMMISLDGGYIYFDPNADYWYHDFRDYAGSSAMLYIPYCGTYQLPITEIQPGGYLRISYRVDMATGSMTAYVVSEHAGEQYPIIIANGQCGFEIPLSATNANRLNATLIADAQKAIGAVLQPMEQAANKVMSGVKAVMGAGDEDALQQVADADMIDSLAIGATSMTLGPVGALGVSAGIKATGNLANVASDMVTRPACGIPLLQGGRGWSALGAPTTPYVQIRRGRYLYPANYTHTAGKPENRTRKVSEIKGYAECVNVDMSGLTCTETEKQMIKRILETGFYRK